MIKELSMVTQIGLISCLIYTLAFSHTKEEIVKGVVICMLLIFATGFFLWIENR